MSAGLRALVRDLCADIAFATRVTRPSSAAVDKLTIVTFHRVLPSSEREAYPLSGLAVTPEELAWFIQFFQRYFVCGSLRDMATAWASSETPERPLMAITFDDGQLDNFVHAKPVLERAGVRGTFFVPCESPSSNEPLWHDQVAFGLAHCLEEHPAATHRLLAELGLLDSASRPPREVPSAAAVYMKALEPSERGRWVERVRELGGEYARPCWDGMMSWDQLAQLVSDGHEVGSHSATHVLLPQCSDSELQYEIGHSREHLQEKLGVPVDSFCYPNGDYDARGLEAVARAGYRFAVTTRTGTNDRGAHPLEFLRRDMQSMHARDRRGALSHARLAWRLGRLVR